MTSIVDLLEACTVRVVGQRSGAGFFVAPGHVLTCAHVVGLNRQAGEGGISVTSRDGTQATAVSISTIFPHSDEDIALLSVEWPTDHPCALLGVEAEYGDTVRTFGFPDYGDGRGPRGDGIVGSYTSRTSLPAAGPGAYFIKFTEALVVVGFSGGPLLDLDTGLVIGVVTETLDTRLPVGGWAIPIATVFQRLPRLPEENRVFHTTDTRWARAQVQYKTRDQHVPWMTGPLPDYFVPRADLVDAVIAQLVSQQGTPTRATVALRGFGGYGKTTLATAVTSDARLRVAFADRGVLWVTLGEGPVNLRDRILDVITTLAGSRPQLSSVEASAARLADILARRECLLVLDDVWESEHLRAFLRASPTCSHLITTRDASVLPASAVVLLIDAMHPSDGAKLLGGGLPEDAESVLTELSTDLGNWPLLIALVNGVLRERVGFGEPVADALQNIRSILHKQGVTGFDSDSSAARDHAVRVTIGLSLKRLSESQQRLFLGLAVFPEDTQLPLDTIARYWLRTGGLTVHRAEDLCLKLARLSLLQEMDLARRVVRLHDVMRRYITVEREAEVAHLHRELVESHRPAHREGSAQPGAEWGHMSESDPYMWEHLFAHLEASGMGIEMRQAIEQFEYVLRKCLLLGPLKAASDLERCNSCGASDQAVNELRRILVRDAHILAIPRTLAELRATMLSRIRDVLTLQNFVGRLRERLEPPYFESIGSLPGAARTALVRTLAVASDPFVDASFDRSGQHLVARSMHGRLYLWELTSGTYRLLFGDHAPAIGHASISADGATVLCANRDGSVVLAAAGDGSQSITLRRAGGHKSLCELTSDGRFAIAWSYDGTVTVWSAESGEQVFCETATNGPNWYSAGSVSVASLVSRLVLIRRDGQLSMWDHASGGSVIAVELAGTTRAVVLAPDGRVVLLLVGGEMVSLDISSSTVIARWPGFEYPPPEFLCSERVLGTSDGEFAVINVRSAQREFTFPIRPFHFAASAVGKRVAAADSRNSELGVWDLVQGRCIGVIPEHSAFAQIRFSPDGETMATILDGVVRLWSVEKLDPPTAILSVPIQAEGHGPGAGVIAIARYDKKVHLVRMRDGELLRSIYMNALSKSLAISSDGRVLAAGGIDGRVRVISIEGSYPELNLAGHVGAVRALSFSANGESLASGGSDGTVRIWHLRDGSRQVLLRGHRAAVMTVTFRPNSHELVSGSLDHDLRVWDVRDGHTRACLQGHWSSVTECVCRPDGAEMISIGQDHTVRRWDLTTGASNEVLAFSKYLPTSCSYNADGTWAVWTDQGGSVWVRRGSGAVGKLPERHSGAAIATFGGSTSELVTASVDRSVRLWNVERGSSLTSLHVDEPLLALHVVPDDGGIVAMLGTASVHLFRIVRS